MPKAPTDFKVLAVAFGGGPCLGGEGTTAVGGARAAVGGAARRGGLARGTFLGRVRGSDSGGGLEMCFISVASPSLKPQLRQKATAYLSGSAHSAGGARDELFPKLFVIVEKNHGCQKHAQQGKLVNTVSNGLAGN